MASTTPCVGNCIRGWLLDDIIWRLSEEDKMLASVVAYRREENKKAKGRHRPLYSGRNSIEVNIQAVAAELAVARYMNLSTDPIEKLHDGGDSGDLEINGEMIEVKYSTFPNSPKRYLALKQGRSPQDHGAPKYYMLTGKASNGMQIVGWTDKDTFWTYGDFKVFREAPQFCLPQTFLWHPHLLKIRCQLSR